MLKSFVRKLGLAFIVIFLVQVIALAQSETGSSSATEPQNVGEAGFQSRCDQGKPEAMGFPPCADSPSECKSEEKQVQGAAEGVKRWRTPFNCLFLEEPIGGRPGYDLYKMTPTENGNNYQLWSGEAIVGKDAGPFQAILTFESGKEHQGPFGLLYNYLALVYNFVSGIIIGFVVLIVIIGGIMISTGGANTEQVTKGKGMIIKALVGMILWFTASVILYTVNPTFFAF